ncbi:MAG: dihydrolipoyl dehydrogenase [Pseudomonadota bacterium]
MSNNYDVIIIGAGPAGYVAAIRCAQLGMKTVCVDKWLGKDGHPSLGGTCLNAGCIPSKALLESSEWYDRLQRGMGTHGIAVDGVTFDVDAMIASKDAIVRDLTQGIELLFKSNGVEWIQGCGQLMPDRQVDVTAHDGSQQTITAAHVILAPGSVPVQLAVAPLNNDTIVDSEGALEWTEVPQRLGIIGAGVIGLELGSVWRRLGAEVTLLEAQDVFLSMADPQIAKSAMRSFQKQGLDIHLGTCVKSTAITDDGVYVEYENSERQNSLTVDRLIVAVGRQPCTEGLATADAELVLNERGFIHVDEDCSTSAPGVYAIGDAVRGPMLAHKGSEEGIAVAERIAGQHSEVNYEAIPSVVYTYPEIAWVGRTEAVLKQAGVDYRTGTFPFAASGRARAMQETDGMVKILSDAVTDRVLGVHILGQSASELIAQAVTAMEFDASSEDIARTVFAHPTLSEAVHEAALALDNRAIHMARSRGR